MVPGRLVSAVSRVSSRRYRGERGDCVMRAVDRVDFERMAEMTGIKVCIIKGALEIIDNEFELGLLEKLSRAKIFEEVMNVYYGCPKWSWVMVQTIRKLTEFFPKRN